jgi:hypothetical protein
MNCANARANFSAYVEHELSEQERRQTAVHLGRCPRCSRDLFAMQKAMSLIRWVPRTDARPGFEERLYARLHATPARAPAVAWWSRLAELGLGFRQRWAESWVPAPVMAVAVAALLGTGSGAFITHSVLTRVNDATMAARQPSDVAPAVNPSPAPPAMIAGSLSAANVAEAIDRAAVTTPATGPAAGTPTSTPIQDVAASELAPSTAPARPATPEAATGRETQRSGRGEAGTVRVASQPNRTAAPMAVASAAPARRPRHDRSAGQAGRVEVAPWAANGGQPIEGPPSVSQVEYILNLVDVNQERVLQLPATAVVSGSTVTF